MCCVLLGRRLLGIEYSTACQAQLIGSLQVSCHAQHAASCMGKRWSRRLQSGTPQFPVCPEFFFFFFFTLPFFLFFFVLARQHATQKNRRGAIPAYSKTLGGVLSAKTHSERCLRRSKKLPFLRNGHVEEVESTSPHSTSPRKNPSNTAAWKPFSGRLRAPEPRGRAWGDSQTAGSMPSSAIP